METYKVFVNGRYEGEIKTNDIEGFVKDSYEGVESNIIHENKMVHLKIGILDAMRRAQKVTN